MEKITLQYDRKNGINAILGQIWIALGGILGFMGQKVLSDKPLQGSHILLVVILIGSYAGFVGIRWFYYNSRTTGHLPMFSVEDLRKLVQIEVEKVVE